MRKLIISSFVILLSVLSIQAEDKGESFIFTDAASLKVCGQTATPCYGSFTRLPARLQDISRKNIWDLGLCSTGVYIRFSSDAGKFRFHWSSYPFNVYNNMTPVAQCGLALYVRDGKTWNYVGSARPKGKDFEFKYTVNCSLLEGTTHEYMLYLSLYSGVKDLQIGIPENCSISQPLLDLPKDEHPVILYGTSITQGASASHPGMSGCNQLARRIDRTVINLGFSGNAYYDTEIAELIASYPDPAAYIIDNWNGQALIAEQHLEDFISIIRKAHPTTPIVFTNRSKKPGYLYNQADIDEYDSRTKAFSEIYTKLRKAGDKNLYFLLPVTSGPENSGSVEGVHFTDDAFTRWVDTVYPLLKRLCRNRE